MLNKSKWLRICFCAFVFLGIKKGLAKDKIFFKKNDYCYDNNLGWKFYCDEEINPEKNNKKEKTGEKKKEKTKNKIDDKNSDRKNNSKTYIDKLNELQKLLEETKAKAVLEPTEDNVKEYMFLQQKIINQASYFSDVWRRILWTTPSLDYTQQRPVSGVGKNIWQSNRNIRELETFKNINKRYGIFFIYSSKCGYCQKYSKILYGIKKEYKVEIKGISIDGIFLPFWENNSFINNGQLEKLGIDYRVVPITVLYDNLTNSVLIVGYGLMTQDDLMARIYVLTQTKLGGDY